jgi:CRISPR-associated protein Cas2
MSSRHLFLIGYDIHHTARRRRTLRSVQPHAMGGQKSFYECWLTVAELHALMAELRSRMSTEADRVVLIRLDARSQSITLGQAEPITNTDYFHVY